MSIILYDKEKFYRVAETLKTKEGGRSYMWAFKYPKGWDDPSDSRDIINSFVSDLYRSNQSAYKKQYQVNHAEAKQMKIGILDFSSKEAHVLPYNIFELYKSLKAIRYNISDNAGRVLNLRDCETILDKIINMVADKIIEELPGYKNAEW